ncbi:NAD(P)/FAD-dependent oxidoreductase [Lacipirellula sp.]|uniref:NAD(P)/FAD-dependent oxidoreductase n=1 Tax=Lacipirellula sp. TaxID=2691419 RepID=UPI003D0AE784
MPAPAATPRPRVVVVGGGFAGLNTVKSLKRAAVDVVLIDRRNFHLFQPLLYQVATGGLSPANIAAPLRWIFSRQKNCEVMLAEVVGFDLDQKRVHTTQGDVPYDYLIVAAGSRHSYFGRDDWAQFAPGLKTIEDATDIRRRVYSAFEQAETEQDPAVRRALLNFAIVGGGPTGVELAGALAEIARHSLKHDFRQIDPSEASITLVEAGDRVLGSFPEDLSEKAHATLQRLGVHIRTKTMATAIDDKGIEMKSSTGVEHWPTRTVLWAAGVKASPLSKSLASSSNADLDRAGRLIVEKDFSLAGRPEVFVLGDMSSYSHQGGKPLPGVAQPAIQQGRFVARLINAKLRGKTLPEFHYHDLGNLATIGRSAAVADIKGVHFSGFIAWWLWLVVHLMHIANFRNRLLVLTQWSWNYFTHDRSARLITGDVPSDDDLAALQNLAVPPKAARNLPPAQPANGATTSSTSTP